MKGSPPSVAATPSAPRTPPPPPPLDLEPLRAPAARGAVAGARRTHTGQTTDIAVGRETGTRSPGCASRSYGPGLGETGVGTIVEDSLGWSRLGGGGGTERASERGAPLVSVVTLAAGRRSAGGMQTPSPPPPWGQDGPNGHVGGHPPGDPAAASRGAIAGTYASPNPHPPPCRTAPARSRGKGGLGVGFGLKGVRLRRVGEPRLTASRRQAYNPQPGTRKPLTPLERDRSRGWTMGCHTLPAPRHAPTPCPGRTHGRSLRDTPTRNRQNSVSPCRPRLPTSHASHGATPPATLLQMPRLLSADSPIITAFFAPPSHPPIS